MINKEILITTIQESIISKVQIYLPKVAGALAIIAIGVIIAVLIYKFIMYIFKKFRIMEMLDNLDFVGEVDKEINKRAQDFKEGVKRDSRNTSLEKIQTVSKKFSNKIKVNEIVAKSISYYVFLIFFRLAIVAIGITEVEDFLGDVIAYLPNLFIAVIIGFFGVRFSSFIYDVVYQALKIAKQKTAKIIASGAKIIVMFLTLMLVLNYTKIVDPFIINAIIVGFVSMLTLAGGLAFGLGGKDIASEILESFRK